MIFFLLINSSDDISRLVDWFQQNSVLTFTIEIGTNNSIHFLDVHVAQHTDKYETLLFKNPTDTCVYRNAVSKCPHRNKESSFKALFHRAYKMFSELCKFTQFINNLKQTFINKEYSNVRLERILNDYVNRIHKLIDKIRHRHPWPILLQPICASNLYKTILDVLTIDVRSWVLQQS